MDLLRLLCAHAEELQSKQMLLQQEAEIVLQVSFCTVSCVYLLYQLWLMLSGKGKAVGGCLAAVHTQASGAKQIDASATPWSSQSTHVFAPHIALQRFEAHSGLGRDRVQKIERIQNLQLYTDFDRCVGKGPWVLCFA